MRIQTKILFGSDTIILYSYELIFCRTSYSLYIVTFVTSISEVRHHGKVRAVLPLPISCFQLGNILRYSCVALSYNE
jgi:hypothetical protein